MKKRTAFLTLLLALAMVLSSISSVFAAGPVGPATDVTKQAIVDAGVQSAPTIKDEVQAESFALDLYNQATTGKYKLISTKDLYDQKFVQKETMVIVDTMPGPDDEWPDWYSYRHIPGAINQVVGAMNGKEFKILPAEKTALIKKVTAAVPKKTIKQYYNKKTKKWQNTVVKVKKYRGKTRKVKVANKAAKVVVYCGFVRCQRSHQAAIALRQAGFTNVYRYAGGISAWVDAGYDVEGSDLAIDYVKMGEEDPAAWDALGISAGDITNSDYVIDVRPDQQRTDNGFVPGAAICPVSNPYTADQAKAIVAEVKKAGDARVVLVCVSGKKLAQNAMSALSAAGVNMENITYLRGGFSGVDGWQANYPVVSPDKTSVSVPAWVTEGAGPNGALMMVKDTEGNLVEKCADMTHHVLVNENGGNAKVALLNTKALPLQVYNALKEIGGKPYDKFNGKDQTAEFSLAGKGSGVNVTIDLGEGPKTLDYYFNHVTKTNAEIIADETITADNVPTEPYDVNMRFSGGLKNIKDNFSSKSGNLTGCITCTFSCWIGTVSNGAYEYNTQETKIIRENAPIGTQATVVYTIGE